MTYSGGIFSSIVTAHFLLALLFNRPPVCHKFYGQYHVFTKHQNYCLLHMYQMIKMVPRDLSLPFPYHLFQQFLTNH
jgi:hypothetical protein